jgi:hypothetical protein
MVASFADQRDMRSVIGICTTFGTIAGSYAPSLWGSGSFTLSSVLCAALGGAAGLWVGVRLSV